MGFILFPLALDSAHYCLNQQPPIILTHFPQNGHSQSFSFLFAFIHCKFCLTFKLCYFRFCLHFKGTFVVFLQLFLSHTSVSKGPKSLIWKTTTKFVKLIQNLLLNRESKKRSVILIRFSGHASVILVDLLF